MKVWKKSEVVVPDGGADIWLWVWSLARARFMPVFFFFLSLHFAVGVHQDGRDKSAGEDFRDQIFKVSLSFFLCQLLFESVWMFF